jgi:hypothetical protein
MSKGGVVRSNIMFWGAKQGYLFGKLCEITGQPKKFPKGSDEERILPCDLSPQDHAKWKQYRNLYTNGCDAIFSIVKRIVMEEHNIQQ